MLAVESLRRASRLNPKPAWRPGKAGGLRRLVIPAALAGVVSVLVVGAASQAGATTNAPGLARHFSLQLNPSASGGHVSTAVPLSGPECAAMKSALTRAHPSAAPMKNCEIGVGLSMAPDVPTRQCGPTGRWTTCYDKGTICFGDRPMWGGKNGSFSCSEAYVSVDGRWKYRTPHNRKVWLLGQVSCPFATGPSYTVHRRCYHRNNGHPILTMKSDFTWQSCIAGICSNGNGYIALYAHYTGKITLYGAWNT
jgi:hypothetical protein